MFSGLGVQVVNGHHFLGGYLGTSSGRVSHLLSLTGVADKEPQAVYAVLTSNEWTFLQHVVPGCDDVFYDLESTLFSQCLYVLFVSYVRGN